MTESLETKIIQVIQEILSDDSTREDVVVTRDDSMETVGEWDSLNFMKVFLAINETFGINPDFDDAVHYTSVAALHRYLSKEA